MSGEIKRHFRDKRWQIRVRRSTQELRLRIRTATAELTQQLSRPPGDAELAAHLGVTEAEVTATQLASEAFQAASLDAPAGPDDDSGSVGDLLGAEDPALEHALDMEAVWKHAAELPPREQHLLVMRFYGNMTQEQIGQELGISQMHVSRLLSRALKYLRDQITGKPGQPANSKAAPGRRDRTLSGVQPESHVVSPRTLRVGNRDAIGTVSRRQRFSCSPRVGEAEEAEARAGRIRGGRDHRGDECT